MSEIQLDENLFLSPTPLGAYYATISPSHEAARTLLLSLLTETTSPKLSLDLINQRIGGSEKDNLELFNHCQEMGFIQGLNEPLSVSDGGLEEALPTFLEPLSDEGKVILADNKGLYISSVGFNHESSVELGALSADLISLQNRHEKLLHRNLGYRTSAWGLLSASGTSEIGFYPLYFGEQIFSLVISGMPQLNRQEFVSLLWLLGNRYSST